MRAGILAGLGVLALLVLGGCGGRSHSQRILPPAVTTCQAADLAWRPGSAVVPMTGEHAEMFKLVNRGPTACSVRGYPAVRLYAAAGAALPVRYAQGGGTYITARKPPAVVLRPRHFAYLVIAMYRCDLGIRENARSVRLSLRLPGGATVGSRLRLPVTGPSGLSYCTGGGRGPGQLVTISPLEPSLRATAPARLS
jgi:Domain of unknown function (DUF4232)